MVVAAVFAAHWYDAAVAAAQSAAHDALDRDLTLPAVAAGRAGDGGQHPLGPAGVDHDRRRCGSGEKPTLERARDPSTVADAPVFGGQFEAHPQVAEQLEREELCASARTVEQRGRDAPAAERLGQGGKWRQTDAAGDHPRLHRRIDNREGTAERAE